MLYACCRRMTIYSFTHCWETKQAHNLRWFRLGWNSFIIYMEKRDILEPQTKIYQKCKSKMPPIKALPPTSPNFALHMKRAHLRVMMWKAAAKKAPPTAVADISKFGSEVRYGVVFIPAIHTGSPPPAQVMRELSCGCRSEQTCVGGSCACQAKHIPCITHCKICTGLCVAIHIVWTNQ